MKKTVAALLVASAIFIAQSAHAEDINAIFKKVTDLVAAKNYSKALDELGWARKEIEKLHFERIKAFFPDTAAGFKGDDIQINNAIGIMNLERTYKKDDGEAQIKLELSGGSNSDAAAGFGNLAAIGRMAAMMGQQPGQDTFRVAGRTATLSEDKASAHSELTVFLDSGALLKLSGDNGVNGAQLKEVLNGIKIEELDGYLKGA